MSAMFGRWHFDGLQLPPQDLERVRSILGPYAPDGLGSYAGNGVDILYRAFHTTAESCCESQPVITASGAVVTWDGRLDNREDILRDLNVSLPSDCADALIAAAAYTRWRNECFAKLIGDWAIAIWEPRWNSLLLAKDPIGARHLYYSRNAGEIRWSSMLEPLLLLAHRTFALEEEYLAGWLSLFPAAHLTPYQGIDAVPPSCFIRFHNGAQLTTKYWDFDPGKRIRYRADQEYEHHFRAILNRSIRRRLRSHCPVLSELSGGIDSSSIVCLADALLAEGRREAPRLDTLSYYDDSEPNWNERPYFTQVESRRGRIGIHINCDLQNELSFQYQNDCLASTPSSAARSGLRVREHLTQEIKLRGNRVLLSGIGGDEFLGGVPDPTPEIADEIAQVHLQTLTRRLGAWALIKKKPWFHLLLEAIQSFAPSALSRGPEHRRPASWLCAAFVRRHRLALRGYPSRIRLFGNGLPSFQENIATLEAVRRQLEIYSLPSEPAIENRYPYLDRELLEFVFALPREQLLRPGQRRSLMRRSLAGIVPEEILNRKRKASVSRGVVPAISDTQPVWNNKDEPPLTARFGIVCAGRFAEAVRRLQLGRETQTVPMVRTIALEFWLQNLMHHGVLAPVHDCQLLSEQAEIKNQNGFLLRRVLS